MLVSHLHFKTIHIVHTYICDFQYWLSYEPILALLLYTDLYVVLFKLYFFWGGGAKYWGDAPPPPAALFLRPWTMLNMFYTIRILLHQYFKQLIVNISYLTAIYDVNICFNLKKSKIVKR